MHAHPLQLCQTLFNSMASSPPGSSVHRILQARILEWLPCPPPGNLLEPGTELDSPAFLALQADSLPLSHQGSPDEYSIHTHIPPPHTHIHTHTTI